MPSGTLRGQRGPRQGAEGTAVPRRALRAAAEPGPRPEGGSRQKGRAAGGGQSPARSPQPPPGPGTTGMVPRGQTSLRPPAPGPGGFVLQPGAAPGVLSPVCQPQLYHEAPVASLSPRC